MKIMDISFNMTKKKNSGLEVKDEYYESELKYEYQ